MLGMRQLNMIVLCVMLSITIVNVALVLNFVTASGLALAGAFNSQTIFIFAGVELAAVLVAYIAHKQKTAPVKA